MSSTTATWPARQSAHQIVLSALLVACGAISIRAACYYSISEKCSSLLPESCSDFSQPGCNGQHLLTLRIPGITETQQPGQTPKKAYEQYGSLEPCTTTATCGWQASGFCDQISPSQPENPPTGQPIRPKPDSQDCPGDMNGPSVSQATHSFPTRRL